MSAHAPLAAVAACLLLAGACGVRTSPRPPEDTVTVVGAVEATRSEAGVTLRWKRPRHSADGKALRDLAGFRIERSEAGEPFQEIAVVAVEDNARVRPQRTFGYLDEDAPASALDYRVRAFDSYGQQGIASPVAKVASRAVSGPDRSR